jgi:hypothetical protein
MSQNKWVKFLMTLSNNLSRNAHGGCAMMMMIVPDCRPPCMVPELVLSYLGTENSSPFNTNG